jgi:hypothetical protein
MSRACHTSDERTVGSNTTWQRISNETIEREGGRGGGKSNAERGRRKKRRDGTRGEGMAKERKNREARKGEKR